MKIRLLGEGFEGISRRKLSLPLDLREGRGEFSNELFDI